MIILNDLIKFVSGRFYESRIFNYLIENSLRLVVLLVYLQLNKKKKIKPSRLRQL